MYKDIDSLCVHPQHSIAQAVERMCKNRLGIVLVTNENRHLLGTITDGDIRRAILANTSFEESVLVLLKCKVGTKFSKPLTALAELDRAAYLHLLKKHQVLHLPLLDKEERVVGLITMDEFAEEPKPALQAVVMAGGRGIRLHPLTENLPKPMLPVGKKPLLEIMLDRLRLAGIQKVNVTTHHKPEKITNHFGDGKDFGVELSYVAEDRPLGTAGALGLLEKPKETLLVINGDVLTEVDFKTMLQYHREHAADLTVAVRSFDFEVPYGVVECEDAAIVSLKEKPSMNFLVNAGIYLLEPSVHEFIPTGKQFHMTDLIQRLIKEKRVVVSFPMHEYWLDIGSHEEYLKAQQQAEKLIS